MVINCVVEVTSERLSYATRVNKPVGSCMCCACGLLVDWPGTLGSDHLASGSIPVINDLWTHSHMAV